MKLAHTVNEAGLHELNGSELESVTGGFVGLVSFGPLVGALRSLVPVVIPEDACEQDPEGRGTTIGNCVII